MTLHVSCNHFPSHQIEIALIHIAMNVICLQWHLSLGWLRHQRLVVSIVVCRHHPSVLTPINYKRSIKAKETTSFKCLNHLKKSKSRWVLYNQQNKLLEGEYLHSGLPVRFLEVQSVSRRKMCKIKNSLEVRQVIILLGFTSWQSCRAPPSSVPCGVVKN